MEHLDHLRKILLLEPRGYPCQNVNFVFPPPEKDKTESEVSCSQSEVKKVVTFDIPENAEEKERIEKDGTPSIAPDDTSDGGGVAGSKTKEDIDPRNELNRKSSVQYFLLFPF